jgi:sulfur transfer complex TusBCD TusB component (DsrH family)
VSILNIVETAYRATLEEQDDTAVWISYMLRSAGADVHLLLRGNAVNYIVKGQDASGLSFGEWQQTHPPDMPRDLSMIMEAGAAVYYIQEDVQRRGIRDDEVMGGVRAVSEGDLAGLIGRFDHVWAW